MLRRMTFVFPVLLFCAFLIAADAAWARCSGCKGCRPDDCPKARQHIANDHADDKYEQSIIADASAAMDAHRVWLYESFFKQQVLPTLMHFTEQMTAIAAKQIMTVGILLDADQQLSTQRVLQEGHSRAQKDYMPSQNLCSIGTAVRSLATTEAHGDLAVRFLDARQLKRDLGAAGSVATGGEDQDKLQRWAEYTKTYCRATDNNGINPECKTASSGSARPGADISFARMIEEPRTLDINVAPGAPETPTLRDVLALGNNLYGHTVLTRSMNEQALGPQRNSKDHVYFALRTIAARRAVAQHSFSSIVGLKAAAPESATNTWQYLDAAMAELGVPPQEIDGLIGKNPSHYAQLEILAKRIFQTPSFYANLYDGPANSRRKSVALRAVERMLDQALYESQLRQEMVTSVLLSSRLHKRAQQANNKLNESGG
ncbi:MAG: hypothetical protein L6Q57_01865 [Alphaproteobacteria bacterium]|nr:hypothetical protein [Alphaproteobacteria bacterium]